MESPAVVVSASTPSTAVNFQELYAYRDLFLTLVYRDLRVRYAQTVLGLAWAILQPAATLAVLTIVFGRAIRLDTGRVPYALFAVTGLCVWTYFAFVLSQSGNAVIQAQALIQKAYFPRLLLPLSKAAVGLVDYLVSVLILAGLLAVYGYAPSPNVVYLPVFILLTMIAALGAGIWISALTVKYRDFQYVVPFVVQFGLYATPVAYPSELVVAHAPAWAVALFYLNPVAGIVDGVRWCVLGTEPPALYSALSYLPALLLLVSGIRYFRRTERFMADVI